LNTTSVMYKYKDTRESAYKDIAEEMEKRDLMESKEVSNKIKNTQSTHISTSS
jgi:hypothetical protein